MPAINEGNLRLYNEVVEKFYGNAIASDMAKTDLPITTASPDAYRYNVFYGAAVFQQLQTSSVLFGRLAKFPYGRNGYRARKTRYLTTSAGSEYVPSTTENASIADTVSSNTVAITVEAQEVQQRINYSQKMLLLSKTNADVALDVANELSYAQSNFIYQINALLNDSIDNAVHTTAIETIDRVVSSYSEVTNCSDVGGANKAGIYSQDRDAAASWVDAYVDHNSDVARPISKKIVTGLMNQTLAAGADPNTQFWYTGSDTWQQLTLMYDSQIRYQEPAEHGTFPTGDGKAVGAAMGKEVGTLYGRPVYVAPAGVAPTTGGTISNLYLLDDHYDPVYKEPLLGIKMLQAPMMVESRFENYPIHGKLGSTHALYAAMQLECKRFNIQGKARDLDVIA